MEIKRSNKLLFWSSLLLLFGAVLLPFGAVAGEQAGLTSVAASERYQAWQGRFAEDFELFLRQRKQGEILTNRDINELFSRSVVADSAMTSLLVEMAQASDERMKLLATMMSILEEARPVEQVPGGPGDGESGDVMVWSMDVTPEDLMPEDSDEVVRAPLLFREVNGQWMLVEMPREFGQVVDEIHAARNFVFSG